MSTDAATLAALERHTKKELRYFELIALRFEGRTDQIFLCIGKHALHLVKRNLAGMYLGEKGGEIFYAHVERLVEDQQSETDLVIIMNENRPSQWPSEKVFVMSENRGRLVEHLAVAWQTDHTWRKGVIVALPRSIEPLRKRPQLGVLSLTPYKDYQKVCLQGYSFFLPESYVARSVQSGTIRSFFDNGTEMEISLRVEEPKSLADLEAMGHDHIRWVATDFRQSITETLSEVMILNNAFYLKKMNLANDIACWTGWEVFFKAESCAMAAIFLRRQYMPPMLDAVQDICVLLTCPVHVLIDGILKEADILQEARVVADSVTPLVQDCTQHQTLYRDMIQAKLDALLFPEDALTWLDSVFALQGEDRAEQGSNLALRRPICEVDAWTFLKSIMTVLLEENALTNPELLRLFPIGLHVLSNPLDVRDIVMDKADTLRDKPHGSAADRDCDPVMNAWLERVARFFAHCVDGFLLGKRFTLSDVAGISIVAEKTRLKIDSAILFLLHARPKDLTKPFVVTSIKHLLHDPGFFHDFTFNDRVMQSLLELGWIRVALASPRRDADDDTSSKSMSLDYASFLTHLLMAPASSNNLKASVCRQLISNQRCQEHFATFMPALMETLNQRSLYLKTYATVTLVNLSRAHDAAKHALMQEGIGGYIMESLKQQDEDLTFYSLVLLGNITKEAHHRINIFHNHAGVEDILTDILRFSVSIPSKQHILSETANVIGQLCVDDHIFSIFCREGSQMVNILLDILEEAELGSKVKSTTMFALRQVCSKSMILPHLTKEGLGHQIIPKAVAELTHVAASAHLRDTTQPFSTLCVDNAVNLLTVLASAKKNAELMAREGLVETLQDIMASPLCHADHASSGAEPSRALLSDNTCEKIEELWEVLHGRRLAAAAPVAESAPTPSGRRASLQSLGSMTDNSSVM